MSIILKIIAVLVGVYLMYIVLRTMKQKKLSAAQSILWFIAAAVIIVLGVFPELLTLIANVLGIWWAPSVLLFSIVVILGFMLFSHAKELSVMRGQLTELSEQVAVLKHELKQREIIHDGKREKEIEDTDRD